MNRTGPFLGMCHAPRGLCVSVLKLCSEAAQNLLDFSEEDVEDS